jgi:hypothetical protein
LWDEKLRSVSKYAASTVLLGTLACLIYTVFSTSISSIGDTDLGLVNLLPPVYYVGLFLLGCLWYIGLRYKLYLPFSLGLTVAYLYFVPAVVRVPVWISNSYYPFGESLIINSKGHLVANPVAVFVSYHEWPLFLYFSSAITTVTGIPHDVLLKFFPIFSVSMYGFFAFLILRIKLAVRYALAGAAFLLGSLFIRQQYFGPQSISYIFFLSILLIVSLLFLYEDSNRRVFSAILIALFVVTTFTHPLTSFMSMVAIFAFYLADRFVIKRRSAIFGRLLLMTAIFWLVYNVTAASSFFNTAIAHFFELFSGFNFSLSSEASRVVTSVAQRVNFSASYAIVGLCGIIAAVSVVNVIWQAKAKSRNMDYDIFNILLLILLALFAFFGQYGEVEAYQRAFLFALVPLSFLCVRLLKKKPLLLALVLVVLIFLNIPAQYGSDNFRLATSQQLSGTKFVADYTSSPIEIAGRFSLYIRYYDPFKNYTVVDTATLSSPFTRVPNSTEVNEALSGAEYVLLSDLEHNYYVFYLGADPIEQANFDNFNQVYDNEGFGLLMQTNSSGP